MEFTTAGNSSNPAILFFHAMGITGDSSIPVANYLEEKYYCIMPTSTVYCVGQKYQTKAGEVQQIKAFLNTHGISEIKLIAASSLGADLANSEVSTSDLSSFEGKTIGVLENSVPEELLTEWEKKNNLHTQHINFSTDESVLLNLENHKMDCFVSIEERRSENDGETAVLCKKHNNNWNTYGF